MHRTAGDKQRVSPIQSAESEWSHQLPLVEDPSDTDILYLDEDGDILFQHPMSGQRLPVSVTERAFPPEEVPQEIPALPGLLPPATIVPPPTSHSVTVSSQPLLPSLTRNKRHRDRG